MCVCVYAVKVVCIYACMHVCMYMYACICVYVYVCLYVNAFDVASDTVLLVPMSSCHVYSTELNLLGSTV